MFDDPRKELERLQRQLLDGEEEKKIDDLLSDAYRLLGDEAPDAPRTRPAPARTQPPLPRTWAPEEEDGEPEDESPRRNAKEKDNRGVTGLLLLLCLELLGIGAVVIYWLLNLT